MSLRTLHLKTLAFSLLSLVTAGCGKSVGSRKPLPFGVMDEPRNGEVVHGTIRVRGWALSESGMAQVLVYVDRKYVTGATLGADRPDVSQAYPAFTNHPDSGWLASLDTSKLSAGTHEIVAQGTANNGATRDLGDVNVAVSKP